jgi:hypothetical protein
LRGGGDRLMERAVELHHPLDVVRVDAGLSVGEQRGQTGKIVGRRVAGGEFDAMRFVDAPHVDHRDDFVERQRLHQQPLRGLTDSSPSSTSRCTA